jgi:hypothetical protein
METEPMPTKKAWLGLALAALIAPLASLHAADEKEKVEGDLKKIQGKWSTAAGNGDKVTYTFDGKKLKLGVRLILGPDNAPGPR